MKRLLLALFVGLVVLAIPVHSASSNPADSVLRLISHKAEGPYLCTAFVVNRDDGILFSNAHCDGDNMAVIAPTGMSFPVERIGIKEEDDLMALSGDLKGLFPSLPVEPFGADTAVTVYGYELEHVQIDIVPTTAMMGQMTLEENPNKRGYFRVSFVTPFEHGNALRLSPGFFGGISGSPVVTKQGTVIAIVGLVQGDLGRKGVAYARRFELMPYTAPLWDRVVLPEEAKGN